MKQVLIVLAILVAVGLAAAAAAIWLSRDGAPIGGPRLLVWTVDDQILDYAPSQTLLFVQAEERPSMALLFRRLSAAREDAQLQGVAVHIRAARFGLAKAQELRRLLAALTDAGKTVDCYFETVGNGGNGTLAYFFATACDSIALAPAGDVNLLGLHANTVFYRGAFDKLKIDPDFASVGEFKSAVETYTEVERSPEAEEALSALLDSLYDQIVDTIAQARSKEPDQVRALIDGAPYTAEEALALGLVDELLYPDEFKERVRSAAGSAASEVALSDYRAPDPWRRGRRIAVVFAQGTIRSGKNGVDPWTGEIYMGSDDVGEVLSELADDDRIEAVVLRVDSPGGSALASDLILREVQRLAEAKPVVVSMSDVAASGGYYISTRSHSIVAEEATLTGSIGVYGGKLVTRRLQEEHLGITNDPMKRGANADIYSSLSRFTPEQLARFSTLMERVYDTFLGHVVDGRRMALEEVERVAAGRVWTGTMALGHGLVDEIGGLDRAIELARERAEIGPDEAVRLEYYPTPKRFLEALLESQPMFSVGEILERWQAFQHRTPGLLELPPELVQLARGG